MAIRQKEVRLVKMAYGIVQQEIVPTSSKIEAAFKLGKAGLISLHATIFSIHNCAALFTISREMFQCISKILFDTDRYG